MNKILAVCLLLSIFNVCIATENQKTYSGYATLIKQLGVTENKAINFNNAEFKQYSVVDVLDFLNNFTLTNLQNYPPSNSIQIGIYTINGNAGTNIVVSSSTYGFIKSNNNTITVIYGLVNDIKNINHTGSVNIIIFASLNLQSAPLTGYYNGTYNIVYSY